MNRLYCAFCKAYRKAFGRDRSGHCHGCGYLNETKDSDKNDGEF